MSDWADSLGKISSTCCCCMLAVVLGSVDWWPARIACNYNMEEAETHPYKICQNCGRHAGQHVRSSSNKTD